MIQTFEFHTVKPGPTILFLAGIHGNETCGPKATRRFIDELQRGRHSLERGAVIIVPVCNPRAFAEGKRFLSANLNRIFWPTKNPTTYEAKLANALCKIIDRADVVVDIHSATAPGQPYIFLDYPRASNRSLAQIIGPHIAISGWPELYKKLYKTTNRKKEYGTLDYAEAVHRTALLIECGQHEAASSARIGYNAILNTLKHYKVIAGTPSKNKLTEYIMEKTFFRKKGDAFVRAWEQFDTVLRGEAIFRTAEGELVTAPHDGAVIMPNAKAFVGEDWVYFGRLRKR